MESSSHISGKLKAAAQTQSKERDYWLAQYAGRPELSKFPYDRQKTGVKPSAETVNTSFPLDTGLMESLASRTGNNDRALHIYLLGGLALLLYIYNPSQEDEKEILVGTPIYRQEMSGEFINTVLPLKLRLTGGMTFKELLVHTRERLLKAIEHQNYPVDLLPEQANMPLMDSGVFPLFDVSLWLDGIHDPGYLSHINHAVRIGFERGGEVARLTFNYNSSLFKESTLDRLWQQYSLLLSNALSAMDHEISSLECQTTQQKQRLLQTLNNLEAGYPSDKTIHQLFEEQAVRTPDHTASISMEDNRSNRTHRINWTYKELNRRSEEIKAHLAGRGISPGSIVALLLSPGLDMIAAILAILKVGAAYLPIDPDYPRDRIDYMLKDSAARLLLDHSHLPAAGQVAESPAERVMGAASKRPQRGKVCPNGTAPISANSPAYIIYTSGTTGKPKGVMVEHRNLVRLLFNDRFQFDFHESDIWTMFHSYCFDFSVWEMYGALLYGGKLVIVPRMTARNPAAFLNLLKSESVSVLNQTPSSFYPLAAEDAKLPGFHLSLRYVIFGGEALNPARLNDWHEKYPQIKLVNMFGITETTVHVTYKEITADEIAEGVSNIGLPIPTLAIRVLDHRGNVLPAGVPGRLFVDGEGVARGYLNRPELSSEKFANGLYDSGDLARVLDNGELEYLGRIDHQIQLRGFRVETGEIENRLISHSSVKDCIVIVHMDEEGNPGLCAYIVPVSMAEEWTPVNDLREFLSACLPDYMIPAFFEWIPEIPLTANGKVDREALPEPGAFVKDDYVPPKTTLEQRLTDLWQESLNHGKIGVLTNYFNAGGDSIKIIKLLNTINSELNTDISLPEFYQAPTIRELAAAIEDRETDGFGKELERAGEDLESLKVRLIEENPELGGFEDIYPMSEIEAGMVFVSSLIKDQAIYHDQFVFQTLAPDFDPHRFNRAMMLMVNKHQILRTSFNTDDYEIPLQRVHLEVVTNIEHIDISDKSKGDQEILLNDFLESERANPFEVTIAPLWRMKTFKVNAKEIVLIWQFHHAILDGWSNASFITELNNTYRRLAGDKDFQPAPLMSSYRDFIVQQTVEKNRSEVIRFWQIELDGYKKLNISGVRSTLTSGQGVAKHYLPVQPDMYRQLEALARHNNSTIKHICLAVFLCTLNMVSYENDFVAGLVTNNRPVIEDADQILGCFLNSVPLRVKMLSGLTPLQHLSGLEQKLRRLKRYERLPLHDIARHIGEEPDARNPVFDILFNYTDFHVYDRMQLDEAPVKNEDKGNELDPSLDVGGYENTNISLAFNTSASGESIRSSFTYNRAFVDTETVIRLAAYFQRILNLFILHPDDVFSKEDVLDEHDRELLSYNWNRESVTSSISELTIHGLFQEQASRTPDHTALVSPGNSISHRSYWSYKELDRRSTQLAYSLKERGAVPGAIIAIKLDQSHRLAEAVLGALKTGAAYLPIDPAYPAERIDYMLNDSRAAIIIDEKGLRDGYVIERGQYQDSNSLAYVVYTSGTTGRPKGVMLEHAAVVNTLTARRDIYKMNAKHTALQLFSFAFDGFVTSFFTPIISGASVIMPASSTIKDIFLISSLIIRYGVTHFIAVPALFQAILETMETKWDDVTIALEVVTLAGDRLPSNLPDARFPFEIAHEYGVTEAAVMSTIYRHQERNSEIQIGKPVNGTAVAIFDSNREYLPVGVYGELYIRGAGLARGYLNNPELTAEKFVDSPSSYSMYRSGDLARWLPDGNIQFGGRADRQVKVRGYRIEPGEIENQIAAIEAVSQAAVKVIQGVGGDSFLCAYIAGTIGEEELKYYLSQNLPTFMIPAQFVFLEALPLSLNGKIDLNALPEPGFNKGIKRIPPRTGKEKQLALIWSKVLPVPLETIGIESSFFHLGGHSLKAAALLSQIHQVFGVRLALNEVFQNPLLKDMAACITHAGASPLELIEAAEAREYYPLSLNQKRLWIIQQATGNSAAYHISARFILDHEVQPSLVKQVLEGLVKHHQSFRTAFREVAGEPVQIIYDQVDCPLEMTDLSNNGKHSRDQVSDSIYRELSTRPFQLDKPPLFRARLVRLKNSQYELMFCVHHIVFDGWSMELLKKQFSQCYDSLSSCGSMELKPPVFQYTDFSQWQNRWLQEPSVSHHAFRQWEKRLRGGIPEMKLPGDGQLVSIDDYRGAGYHCEIPGSLKASLEQLALEQKTSLFVVMLTALEICLASLTGEEKVICGIPGAGREEEALETVIGFFLNTILSIVSVEPEISFLRLLKNVHLDFMDLLNHQQYPIEPVLDRLNLPFPRLPVLFNMLNMRESTVDLEHPGQESAHIGIVQDVKSDINIFVTPYVNGLRMVWHYRKSKFRPSTFEYIVKQYLNLLEQIARQPARAVKDFALFRLEDLNIKGNRVLPRNEYVVFEEQEIHQSASRRFEAMVAAYPGKIALKSGSKRLSYDGLNRLANRLAHCLMETPDGAAALFFNHGMEMIAGILGVLKSGRIYVPLDPGHPAERSAYILGDSGARVIVTNLPQSPQLQKLRENLGQQLTVIDLNTLSPALPDDNPAIAANPDDAAYILYTSGSTGRPKGVLQNHRNLLHHARIYTNQLRIHSEDRISLFSSYGFDAAKMDIYGALFNGATLYPYDIKHGGNLSRLPGWLKQERITIYHSIPTVYRYFTDMLTDTDRFDSIRFVVLGGEAVFKKDVMTFKRFFSDDCIFVNGLGPTESTLTLQYFIGKDTVINREAVPVGFPVPHTRVYLLDENDHETNVFGVGEITYKSPYLALGYVNQPLKTDQAFGADPIAGDGRVYRTGDLGRRMPDGNIEYVGRKDFQVKVRGYRIEPAEIEGRLDRMPGIKKSVVVCSKDQEGENILTAFYTVTGENQRIDELQLVKELKSLLPDYMIPQLFWPLESFPLTATGKIDRGALSKDISIDVSHAKNRSHTAPRNVLEKRLAELWEKVLRCQAPGIDDNFFVSGGNSLKAIVLLSGIHKAFNVQVPLADLFRFPTIRELSLCIAEAENDIYQAIEPAELRDYYPLSSAQKRLFFLHRLEESGVTYNMPNVFKVSGEIDVPRYEAVFKQLIRRHHVLRTSFHMLDEHPIQRVHDRVDFEIERCDSMRKFVRPFDLSKAPLLRAGISSDSSGGYLLMYDLHHIICDGTSGSLLMDDFIRIYENEELPPLRIQYKDFSLWQYRMIQAGLIDAQERYWMDLYTPVDEIPQLELPTDYRRPDVFDFTGDRFRFSLEGEDVKHFRRLGEEHGATLYIQLLAILNLMLHKYTGQRDIIVGAGVLGRPHADLQDVIGMFVNTLAMRNRPAPSLTYLDFLKEVRDNALEAFENQDLQFEELVDKLELKRDPSRNPLFDVLMVVQNFQRSQRQLNDVSIQTQTFENNISKFDLTLYAFESDPDVHFVIEYCTALFKPGTIERMARHFLSLIRGVSKLPQTPCSELQLISAEERSLLVKEFNRTQSPFPADKTIPQLFEEQVERFPDQVALVGPSLNFAAEVSLSDVSLTYAELDRQANRLARYLHDEKNTRPDEPVAMLMERSLEMIVTIMGILKAGSAYLPIDPVFPEEHIKDMLEDAEVGILISQKRFVKTLNRLQWECPSFHTYLCMDSMAVHLEEEVEKSELMETKLWEYVGENAVDEITGGGWLSSYTGEPIPKQEMDEYGDNVLKKLKPLLHPEMRVLEVGCASGITMYRLAPHVSLYYGTDLSNVIIQRNRLRNKEEGHKNIRLDCLAAHEIKQVGESGFDLVIINSVIQCFHGHNYLRRVLRDVVDLMSSERTSYLFIGDIMDQDLKTEMLDDFLQFKRDHEGEEYTTKTDWSTELFLSRHFFQDLAKDISGITDIQFSDKIYTMENELTKFRYDALLTLDKRTTSIPGKTSSRYKYQDDLRSLEPLPPTKLRSRCGPENLSYIIYTSGSTGKPKGTLTTHSNVSRVVKNTNYIEFQSKDRVLQLSNYAFDGSVFDIYGALLNGSTLALAGKNQAMELERLAHTIKTKAISVFFVTTALFNTLADYQLDCLTHVRKILFGGEQVSVSHVQTVLDYLGKGRILHVYGPTETTVYATWFPVDEIDWRLGTIPIGKPISNTTAYILDTAMKPTPLGVVGEIYIGGAGVARGYLKRPALSAEKFLNSPFLEGERLYRTGDLGRFLPSGDIRFEGRIDHQVKIRGFRIEPGEVENRLKLVDGIIESVVLTLQDPLGEKFLCAYIVGRTDKEPIDTQKLKEELSRLMPDYMVPGFIIQIDELPLTPNGKLDRKRLPSPEKLAAGESSAPPEDAIQNAMAGVWSEVLGIAKSQIGIDDDFFESGGHSLKATVFVTKIHKLLNVRVPLTEVFMTPTIRELANYARQQAIENFVTIESLEKRQYYPLSSAQKRLYILNRLDPRKTAYNEVSSLILEGKIDVSKMEETIREMIKRHESLRTSFRMIGDTPVQIVHEPESVSFQIQHPDSFQSFVQPFDLAVPPLLRVGLIKVGEDRHQFVLDMHHIITDGTSMKLFSRDFMSFYGGQSLPPLRIQYKDFATWQNRSLAEEAGDYQRRYWIEQFQGEIPALNLPLDFHRPQVQSYEGGRLEFEIGENLTRPLKALALKENVTMYMMVLALYNVLLHKLSGQRDIIVGSVIAGRKHADLQNVLGMFVNTLALRAFPEQEKLFSRFLKEIKDKALKSFENQDYQFEDLVDALGVERDTSRNPVFTAAIGFHNFVVSENPSLDEVVETPGLKLSSAGEARAGASKFDITLHGNEYENILKFSFEYCVKLFRPETIQRFVQYFKCLISEILNKIHQPLCDIDILPADEKSLILHTFNDSAASYPYPENRTIHQLFQDQAQRSPYQIALSYDEHQLSYEELDLHTNLLSHELMARGAKAGSIIALMLDSPFEVIIAILGVLKSGAAYLPIDPENPRERINFILQDSNAKFVIDQSLLPRGALEGRRVSANNSYSSKTIPNAHSSIHSYVQPGVQSGDPAYIIYTSGSTGRPKGVIVEHRGIVNLNILYREDFQIESKDRVLQFASFTFDASVSEIFMGLLNGALVEPVPRRIILDHQAFELFMQRRNITIATIPPPYLVHLDPAKFNTLRILLTAGSQTSFDLLERWRCNTTYINAYGPTEASICITWWRDTCREEEPRERYTSVPIGKALNNTHLYVLDKYYRLQPLGVAGELCVSGAGLARGYLNQPELSAKYFIPNPFTSTGSPFNDDRLYRTGDLCRWFMDGNLEFLGRIDQQVKIRGYRVELGEIENRLLEHDMVKEAAVAVRGDQTGNDTLCAYVAPVDSGFDGVMLKEYLSRILPQYMVPSFFTQLEKLPFTPSGKIDRRALPDPDHWSTEKYIPPRDYIEKTLVRVWSQVLETDENQIGIDDDFFASGGHSLKAMVLAARIRQALDIDIPMTEIFNLPTVRGIADYIKKNAHKTVDKHPVIEAGELKEYYPLSSAQMRLYILYRWEPDGLNYNVPRVLVLQGRLDTERLHEVFQRLIHRHESFRTTFIEVDSQPRQRILPPGDVALKIESFNLSHLKGDEQEKSTLEIIDKTFIRPFHLSCAPLLRVGLIKQSEQRHILMADVHHSVSDGTSMAVLTREFSILYDGGDLPELPLQYRDYAQWQQQELGQVLKRQEAFWLDQFSGEIPVLNLPYDFPRPEMQQFDGGFIGFNLTAEESAGLNRLASRQGATLFMTLLAVCNVFLSKLSGQEDIVVGTPLAGRRHADLQHIVGMFIDTLTFRNYPASRKTFLEFLDEVKTGTLAAYDNQEYQFEELVERLSVKRDTSRNPLFDVMFALHNMEVAGGFLPDQPQMTERLQISPYPHQYSISKFDITFHGWETGDSISFNIEYSVRLFKEQTIREFIKYFRKTIRDVLENPDTAVGDIEVLDERQKTAILEFSCGPEHHIDTSDTLHGWFSRQAEETPDHVAVVSGVENTRYLTYGELNRRALCLAHHLIRLGIGVESLVGLMVERSLELVISMLAVMKAGAAYLAIDRDLPDSRKQFILEDGGVGLLLSNDDAAAENTFIPAGVELVDVCNPEIYENRTWNLDRILPDVSGSNLVYVIYTSGSTGKPKGLMIQHGNMVNLFHHMYYYTNIDCTSILQFSTIVFDVAVHEIFSALLSGGKIYLISREMRGDVPGLFKYIENQQIRTVFLPMAFLKMIFSEPEYIELFPCCVRHIQTAGEQVVVSERFASYLKDYHVHLHNHYGPAETHVITTYTADPEKVIPTLPSIGKPLINTDIYIVDARLHLVPRGVPGELCAAGLQVGRGYLNHPGLTKEKFIPSPFTPHYSSLYKTGDLARWMADGNIEFLGRIDTQVKIRGFRIEMGEIETRLLNYPGIKEAAVKAISTGASHDKRLCAYIISGSVPDYPAIREYLAQELPDYMVPAHFVALDAFPLTASGKIDRKVLPMPDLEDIDDGEAYVPAQTSLEEKLIGIWAAVLELPRQKIGVQHNFFSLGGQSLKATVLVSKIHKSLDIKLLLTDIFKFPTIRGLAGLIAGKAADVFQEIPPVEEREYYSCSSAQKRLFILQQLDPLNTTYNITSALTLEGEIDVSNMQDTFVRMIRRHQSFRTSFRMKEGEPVQVVHEPGGISFKIEFPDSVHAFVRPFDLSNAPLLRAGLIKLESNRHLFIVDMHHIITDGTSMKLFSREFMRMYDGETLPELNIQYKDFSAWQNRLLEGKAGLSQRQYWRRQFSGDIPRLNLPLDFPRPAVQSFEGGLISFELGGEQVRQLKKLTLRENVTMYMMVLAIYNLLLAKLSGQEDIVVGSVIAGRQHTDLRNIIGMFVNTLAIRCHPSHDKSFSGFLREIKDLAVNSFENQDYQFEELVEALGVERDASRNPIFTAAIGFHNMVVEEDDSGEELIETTDLKMSGSSSGREGISKFDITLHASELANSIIFSFEYCTRLFKQDTIERFSRYFKLLAAQVLKEPAAKLNDIDMVPVDEKSLILETFNSTRSGYPQDKTIHCLFEEQALRSPDDIALVSATKNSFHMTSISYSLLNHLTDDLAARLNEQSIGAGCIVAIKLEPSLDLIIAILGVLKTGAAYLPIDPAYPRDRIGYMLKDSGASCHIDDNRNLNSMENSNTRKPLRKLAPNQGEPGGVAYIIYTSGTTGRPKGVMVEHRSLVNLCTWHNRNYAVSRRDRASKFAGVGFDASVWEIFPYLISGASLYIIDEQARLDMEALNRCFERYHITIAFLPTPICEQFMRVENRSLRTLLTGGDRLRRFTPANYHLYNNYGPTEYTVVSTSFPVTGDLPSIPIGKPIDNSRIYIIDAHDNARPLGVAGELCVGGAGLARGYLNNPELTAERFVTFDFNQAKPSTQSISPLTVYRTGDLARWLPDGNIEFLGRADEQVKIRGYRIELKEIETHLKRLQGVAEAVVLVKKKSHRQSGDSERYLCCYWVSGKTGDSAASLNADRLKLFLGDFLPDYMIPSTFVNVNGIPLTPNQKIDKKRLLEIGDNETGTGRQYTAPASTLEKQIAAIWQEVLQVDKIGVHDNFFDIGGNSLNVITLANELKKVLEKPVDVMKLFQHTSIHSLARFLNSGDDTPRVLSKQRGEAIERGKSDKRMRQMKSKQRRERRKRGKENRNES